MLNAKPIKTQSALSEICYIGLGSNLNSPVKQIQEAITTISRAVDLTLNKTSSFYSSPPMGPQDQDDYINAVIKISTKLSALSLLDQMQKIELVQGRVRKSERWGARTLDLDLLLYGNQRIENDRLTVPHYGMFERAFVLYPLHEIEQDLIFPSGEKLDSLVTEMRKQQPIIRKLVFDE